MSRIEILTSDTAWAQRHGTPGRDGRTIIEAEIVERCTVAATGRTVVTFDLPAGPLPIDYGNRRAFAPATRVLG